MQKKRKGTRVHEYWWFQVSTVSIVVLWVKSGEGTRECQGEEVGSAGVGVGGLENKGAVSQVLSHPKFQQGAAILTCMFTHSTIKQLDYESKYLNMFMLI